MQVVATIIISTSTNSILINYLRIYKIIIMIIFACNFYDISFYLWYLSNPFKKTFLGKQFVVLIVFKIDNFNLLIKLFPLNMFLIHSKKQSY